MYVYTEKIQTMQPSVV